MRERKEEIPILLKHFMAHMSERYARAPLPLSAELLQACQDYAWPGNLRELNNFVKRYLVLGDEKLAIQELRPKTDGHGAQFDPALPNSGSASGGLKSVARGAKDEAEAEAISKLSTKPTGIASKLQCCSRSATRRFCIRSASTASRKPKATNLPLAHKPRTTP